MEMKNIKKIVDMVKENDITTFKLVLPNGETIEISRELNKPNQVVVPQQQQVSVANTPANTAPVNPDMTVEQNNSNNNSNNHLITSPMVGTFYSSPSPTSKPFVSVGQKISKGDTLCIVEAMKMMNQIESDKSGVIVDILANDGDSVEFEQELFVIA